MGVPTANLDTRNELVPPHGVYATTVTIDGVVYPSVTNIGLRPTFGDVAQPVIEVHALGSIATCTASRLRLGFVQRLRDERRFPDVDALKAQIDADVRRARRLFDRLMSRTVISRRFVRRFVTGCETGIATNVPERRIPTPDITL